MINVLVNGCNGRMGQEVIKQMDSFPELFLSCGFDRTDNGLNTFPVFTAIRDILEPVDVIVDFSVPASTFNILEYALAKRIPIVIATTGFSDEQMEKLEIASRSIPIFQSANMSYDINLMCEVLKNLAPHFKDADIEILETHHNRKIDAPSGTALLLANSINEANGNNMKYVFDRFDKKQKREKNEIGFSSIRGGNIVGEHSVLFFGENETFELKHTTYSRSVFAEGALKACEFVVKQPVGFYHMEDLVNFKK